MKKKFFSAKRIFAALFVAACCCIAGCGDVGTQNPQSPSGPTGTTVEVTDEYTLVDFKQQESEQYITIEDPQKAQPSSYEMTSEGVVFKASVAWNSHFIYTLPQPIVEKESSSETAKKEDIYSLTFRYKAEPAGNNFTVRFWDISGNRGYVNFHSMGENVKDGEWTESTVYWHELKYQLDSGGFSDHLRIRSLKNLTVRLNGEGATDNSGGSVVIDSVRYTRNETNYGKENGDTGETVLADFGVTQYVRFFSAVDRYSGTQYAIADGGLQFTLSEKVQDVWNGALQYTLMESIPVSQISKLKFKADSSFLAYVRLVGDNGETLTVLPMDENVTIEALDNGMHQYTADIESMLSEENSTMKKSCRVSSIRLTCASKGSAVFIDDITYTR